MAGNRARARRCRLPFSELCRDRRRHTGGVHIYRNIDHWLRRLPYRDRTWPRTRGCRLCSVVGRRFCRCLHHRLSCRYVWRAKKPRHAMRVSAYAPTAAWVAGVFNTIPALAFLGILGLYSLYLLHTGIVALMKPAPDKAVLYTIAVIVCAIIVWIVIFGITALLFGV